MIFNINDWFLLLTSVITLFHNWYLLNVLFYNLNLTCNNSKWFKSNYLYLISVYKLYLNCVFNFFVAEINLLSHVIDTLYIYCLIFIQNECGLFSISIDASTSLPYSWWYFESPVSMFFLGRSGSLLDVRKMCEMCVWWENEECHIIAKPSQLILLPILFSCLVFV